MSFGSIAWSVSPSSSQSLSTEWDALNRETTYEYDALGRLVKVSQPSPDGSVAGPETEYTYDALGQRLSVIDPLDRVTSWAYDLLGRVKSETGQDPDGGGSLPAPVTSYTYDAEGRMLSKTGSDSRLPVTTYGYDALGRLTDVTEDDPYNDDDNPVTVYEYDEEGNLTKVIDPEDRETTHTYDLLGRRTKTTAPDPDGSGTGVVPSETDYGYDNLGRTKFVENPIGKRTVYYYDFLGRMIEERQPDPDNPDTAGTLVQPKTLYAYDEVGNVVSVTDPMGNVHAYEYDDFDRLETAIDPNLEETQYEYDEVGNLTRKVDRRGLATEYAYDGLDRRTSEIWKNLSDDPVNTISYTYDIGSQLTAASDLRSTYAYTYDGLGRLKTVDNDGSYDVPQVVLTNSYDTAGLRSKVAAEIDGTDDFETTYEYDILGRIRDIKQTDVSGGNSVSDKRIRFTYATDGQLSAIARYESLDTSELVQQTSYAYDGAGRLETLRHYRGTTTTVQHSYNYDKAGRVVSYVNSKDGTVTYAYDDTNQLEGANYSSSQTDETYAYDESGNRTGTGVTTGTGNQLTSDGTYTYEYDDEGNRTKRTEIATGKYVTYVWDHRNRLTSVREYTSAAVQLKRTNYFYDLFDRRIAEDNDTDGNGSVDRGWRFVYDTSGKTESNGHATEDVVLLFDKDGNLLRRYLHGPDVDQVLAEEWVGTNADVWWNFGDKLGTIRDRMAYVLSTDEVFWRVHVTYDAFGNVVNETDEYANAAIASTHVRSMKNTAGGWLYGYAGREHDADVDLQYNRARWYDSRRGIFLSEDPIFADRANTYRYAGNGVTNATDPSGMEPPLGWSLPVEDDGRPSIGAWGSPDPKMDAVIAFQARWMKYHQSLEDMNSEVNSTQFAARRYVEEQCFNYTYEYRSLQYYLHDYTFWGMLGDSLNPQWNGLGTFEDWVHIFGSPYLTYAAPRATEYLPKNPGFRGYLPGLPNRPRIQMPLMEHGAFVKQGPPRAPFPLPFDKMSETEQRSLQHFFDRHAVDLSLPNWQEKKAESLRQQANCMLTTIRANATEWFRSDGKPHLEYYRSKVTEVRKFEWTVDGKTYFYYETVDGQFVSGGLDTRMN